MPTEQVQVQITADVARFNSELKKITGLLKSIEKTKVSFQADTTGVDKAKKLVDSISKKPIKIPVDDSQVRKSTESAKKLNQELDKSSQQRGTTAGSIGTVAIAGGLAAGIGKNVSVFADLESTLNGLQSLLGLTAEQMDALKQKSIELGKDITLPGVSAKDASDAMVALARNGFRMNEVLASAKPVLQLAKTSNIEFAESARIVASTLKAFGLPASEASKVVDQFANASRISGATLPELADGMSQVAAVAKQFGFTLTDTEAGLAALSRAGIKGSDAGTSLKNMFMGLVGRSGPASEALASIGVSLSDSTGKIKPFLKILSELHAGLKKLSEGNRVQVIEQIFGTDAIRSASILSKLGPDLFGEIADEIEQAGTAESFLAAQNSGLKGSIDALGSTLETMGLAIGEKFAPYVKKAVDAVSGFIEDLDKAGTFANKLKTFFESPFGTAIVAAIGTFTALVSVIKLATGAMSVFNAVSAMNPIGLVIAAVGALAAGAVVLYNKWQPFKEFVDDLWQKTQRVWDAIVNGVKVAVEAVTNFVNTVKNMSIGEIFSTIGNAIWDGILTGLGALGDLAAKIGGIIWDALKNAAEWLKDNWTKIIGIVLAAPFAAIGAILFGAGKIGQFLGNFIVDVIGWLWDHKDEFVKGLIKVVSFIFNIGKFLITDVLPAIVKGVATFVPKVVGVIWEGITNIPSFLGDKLPEIWESFNKTLQGIPGKIIDGIVTAFNTGVDFAGKIGEAIKNVFVAAIDGLVTAGSWLKDNWLKIIGGLIAVPFVLGALTVKLTVKLVSFIKQAIEGVVTALPGLMSALWGIFVNILEFVFVTLPTKAVELGSKLGGMIFDAIAMIPGIIAGAAELVWNGIKWVVETVIRGFETLVSGVWWVIQRIVDFFVALPGRIVDAIGAIGSFIWNAISGAFDFVKNNISSWVDGIVDLFKSIGSGIVDGVLGALRTVAGAINGIIGGFNKVTGFVGLPELPTIPEFHTGGVVGDGGRMRTIQRKRSDEQLAMLLEGEGVIPQGAMRTWGTEMFQMMREGDRTGLMRALLADGHSKREVIGLDYDRMFTTAKQGDGIGGFLKGVASDVLGAFGIKLPDIGALFTDNTGRLYEFVKKYLFKIVEKVKGLLFGAETFNLGDDATKGALGYRGAIAQAAGKPGSWRTLVAYLEALGVPHVVTSTFRPFAVTQSGNLSYHAQNRAVDLAPPGGGVDNAGLGRIFWAFKPVFDLLAELIYAGPQTPFNIKNGAQVAKYAQSIHHNHVHAAAEKGGVVRGSARGKLILAGERNKDEAILPLNDRPRSREILKQLGFDSQNVTVEGSSFTFNNQASPKHVASIITDHFDRQFAKVAF